MCARTELFCSYARFLNCYLKYFPEAKDVDTGLQKREQSSCVPFPAPKENFHSKGKKDRTGLVAHAVLEHNGDCP